MRNGAATDSPPALHCHGSKSLLTVNSTGCKHALGLGLAWLRYVYANWCKACQAFAPVYEHIAEKFEHVERVRIAALNSDEAPELIKQ